MTTYDDIDDDLKQAKPRQEFPILRKSKAFPCPRNLRFPGRLNFEDLIGGLTGLVYRKGNTREMV